MTDRPILLERGEELAAIDALIADVLADSGRLAVIEGSAGIGKSSILTEGRTRAAGSGLTVLRARGTEIERAFSYGGVRQLFETLVAQADSEQRAALFDGAAAHARRLLEPDQPASETAAGEDAAFALVHGLHWLALNLSERGPLLLAVDDLQWLDAASLRWLAYLARRLEGVAIGILGALRPIADEDPALVELLADPATTIVKPSALTPAAVTEIVRADLSSDADEAFCLACHRTTGGNPLLLQELVRTLVAEGIAPSASAVETVERIAPDAVARSVKLRLSRLPDDAAALARAVAILGDGVDARHAGELAGLENRLRAPAAATLARADLLWPEPPLRFVHPLVRNAVYESIPLDTRAASHAGAAQLLATAAAPAEQVAAQLLRAPAESVDEAVGVLRKAAARATAEGSPESAARYLGRALEEPLPDAERAELLLDLAGAESSLGSATVIDHLRNAVGLFDDPERRVLAQWQLGRALYWAGDEEAGIAVLDEVVAVRNQSDDMQCRLLAELIANMARQPGHHEEAWRRINEVEVTVDEGPGARMLVGHQAYFHGARGGDREWAASHAEQALAAMDDEERAWNYTTATYALFHTDRLDEGVRLLDPTLAASGRNGAAFNHASLSMTRAILHYARGALLEAEADARAALEGLPHRNVWFVPHAHGWLAQILVERGEVDESAELVAAVEDRISPVDDPFSSAPLLRARSMARAARGDHRGALEDALELGRALTAFGHTNPAVSYPAWRSLAALEHHALGEADAAGGLARAEVELARRWGAPRTLGRSLRILGLTQGGKSGIGHIEEAAQILRVAPARLEYAYALADLGAALRRANRRAQARDPLREALELAQRLGGRVLADRAHEELLATGARPRRLVLSGVDSLTPSERRIAAMAAEGLSNRDIAQTLFVTLRTVEMHLSNAFRKLDVSSRTQLPAALASSATEPVAAAPS